MFLLDVLMNLEYEGLISIETKDSFYSGYFVRYDSKYLYFVVNFGSDDVLKVELDSIINLVDMEYLMQGDDF